MLLEELLPVRNNADRLEMLMGLKT